MEEDGGPHMTFMSLNMTPFWVPVSVTDGDCWTDFDMNSSSAMPSPIDVSRYVGLTVSVN